MTKRGAVHGVAYTNGNEEESWTPVTGRRSKKPKRSVPLHLRLRAPPQIKSNLPPSDESDSDSDSDGSDVDLIPDQANVKYSIINGKPGLQINTKCTWS